jgi:tRNA nucleotidyltransferase/poly(A) polymerase
MTDATVTPIEALIYLLADTAFNLDMGHHSYIVGGAPRDFVMGHAVKDIDVVVEAQGGKDAATLARAVADRLKVKTNPDRYGVCHVGPVKRGDYMNADLSGLKVEIVTARREKYDRTRGSDSHKPVSVEPATILEDLKRRDFTINTLMWKLSDLLEGTAKAPVTDLLGSGLADIRNKVLRTPLDPHETFDDDPTRMLRAVRFEVKFDFAVEENTTLAIKSKAEELRRLPYEAFDTLFFDKMLCMERDKVELAITLMDWYGLLGPVKDMIPGARMRRAIQERVKDVRLLVYLAGRGIDVGVKFKGKQLKRFQDAAAVLDDTQLLDLFHRFQRPVGTEEFITRTKAQGPAIGRAVERARDLVLLGLSQERVFEILVDEHNTPTGTL